MSKLERRVSGFSLTLGCIRAYALGSDEFSAPFAWPMRASSARAMWELIVVADSDNLCK
jgi:hypothetical protein